METYEVLNNTGKELCVCVEGFKNNFRERGEIGEDMREFYEAQNC